MNINKRAINLNITSKLFPFILVSPYSFSLHTMWKIKMIVSFQKQINLTKKEAHTKKLTLWFLK